MSRMTKYLKQTATIQRMLLDSNGNAKLDMYGEPMYGTPIKLKCRRERVLKDVLTPSGAVKRSSTCYYLDSQSSISFGDLIDGKSILDFEEYTNEYGKTEGYMVIV